MMDPRPSRRHDDEVPQPVLELGMERALSEEAALDHLRGGEGEEPAFEETGSLLDEAIGGAVSQVEVGGARLPDRRRLK